MSSIEIEDQDLCDKSIAASEATDETKEHQKISLKVSLPHQEQLQLQLRPLAQRQRRPRPPQRTQQQQKPQEPSKPLLNFCLSLFHLCWDDILIPNILLRLDLKDLFTLRCCSKTSKELVEAALCKYEHIHLSGNNSRNIHLAFAVLSKLCKRLRSIQLANCQWLNDALLLPMLTNNNCLQIVNLNDCLQITPVSLQPLIWNCKELRTLKLAKCRWLSVGAIEALTLHHRNLEEVDISYCQSIGERCLSLFFHKLSKLKIICLAHVGSVTDNVLISISNHCPLLEHINLIGCSSITDLGLVAIGANCINLQTLCVEECLGPPEWEDRQILIHLQYIYAMSLNP